MARLGLGWRRPPGPVEGHDPRPQAKVTRQGQTPAGPWVAVQEKTVLVTGANSGIGLATAQALAQMGARVYLTSRDAARGDAARDRILDAVPDAQLAVLELDLADPASIYACAAAAGAAMDHLDVLVNNAGLWMRTRVETAEGFERTFAVNHLGPWRLTHALLPLLQAAPAGRVVTVASMAHRVARVDWDDLQMEQRFSGDRAYANSKLFNIWFSDELARRLEGTTVTSNCLHPGTGGTGLTRDFPAFVGPVLRWFGKSPLTLAKTSVRLASSPELAGVSGGYFHGRRRAVRSSAARDPELAVRAWAATEQLVGASSLHLPA